MNALLKDTINKSIIIADQKAELQHLCSLVKRTNSHECCTAIGYWYCWIGRHGNGSWRYCNNHVVENVTNGLVEHVTMPLGQRRAILLPLPPKTQQTLDTQRTQDSLSFPPIDEVGQLRASNSDFKICMAHWWNNITNGSWLASRWYIKTAKWPPSREKLTISTWISTQRGILG